MMFSHNKKIHIGTSGWEYKHWVGPFYPQYLNMNKHLAYYCQHFHTVEINNTFYQLPTEKKLQHWYEIVSEKGAEDFIFSVKASRFTTHMKKLQDPEKSTGLFFERIKDLKETLGPILFQLPPRWHCNPERLDSFLKVLPKEYQYAFELRDETWFNNEIDEILIKNKAAFCIYEIAGQRSPLKVTGDLVYVRLHGPEEIAYTGRYKNQVLEDWAQQIVSWSYSGKEIYCYFDNDQKGYAIINAKQLLQSVSAIETSRAV